MMKLIKCHRKLGTMASWIRTFGRQSGNDSLFLNYLRMWSGMLVWFLTFFFSFFLFHLMIHKNFVAMKKLSEMSNENRLLVSRSVTSGFAKPRWNFTGKRNLKPQQRQDPSSQRTNGPTFSHTSKLFMAIVQFEDVRRHLLIKLTQIDQHIQDPDLRNYFFTVKDLNTLLKRLN